MYIDHVKTFLEVASTGSFQLAAEKLFVTQSTVSARIKALEDQLNRPLFIRKRTGIALTSGGRRFHPYAMTMVQAWGRARQEIALPESLSSIMNLGVQLNHWNQLAAPWVVWMEQNLPDCATQVVAEYSEALMRKVRNGELELAVVYEPQRSSSIVVEHFMDESLVLVSTKPRGLSMGQVPGYVFINWGESFCQQHNQEFPDTPTHRLTVSLGAVGLEHILKRGGSGYLSLSMVRELLADGTLHRVDKAPVFRQPLYLVYQKEAADQALLNKAMEGLRQIGGACRD